MPPRRLTRIAFSSTPSYFFGSAVMSAALSDLCWSAREWAGGRLAKGKILQLITISINRITHWIQPENDLMERLT